jgi:hypothetical protein
VDSNGLDVQLAAGAEDTQGNFTPVGNNYLVKHGCMFFYAGCIIR